MKIAFSFLQNAFAKNLHSFRKKEKHLAFAKCLLLVGMSGLETFGFLIFHSVSYKVGVLLKTKKSLRLSDFLWLE